jgi:hypothetical protein
MAIYEVVSEKIPNSFAGVTAMYASHEPMKKPIVISTPCTTRLKTVSTMDTLFD